MIIDSASAGVHVSGGVTMLLLSDAGELTQLGAYVASLAPETWSSKRHWHDREDEFVLVLD